MNSNPPSVPFLRHSGLAPESIPFEKENVVSDIDSRLHGDDKKSQAFTLIELLIVIAIIAILSIVVVLTLSPAEMLRQARDATRLSDMDTMNRALGLYVTDMATQGTSLNFGNASTVYVSLIDNTSSTCGSLGLPALPAGYIYHCSSATSSRLTDGNGWLPVSLRNISSGSPLGTLLIDPQNSSSTGLYYTYVTNGSQYEVTSLLESQKYKVQYGQNPPLPSYPEVLAQGSNLTLNPLWNPQGLMGYWPMDEGSGTVVNDASGNGNFGSWMSSPINQEYQTGKVGPYAGFFSFFAGYGYNFISLPSFNLNAQPFTVMGWVYMKSAYGSHIFVANPYGGVNQTLDLVIRGTLLPSIDFGGYHLDSPSAVNLNTWVHVAATWNGPGTIRVLYLNGIVVASDTPLYSDIVPAGATTTIGTGAYPNGSLIDDVRIYNRSLSAAEIQALYNAEK